MAITDIKIISGNSSDISPPEGYRRVNQDLNQGAGGEYVYLCYTEGAGLGAPITDITVITGDSPDVPVPAGYTKVDTDLNKGAGGKFIYLCVHRGEGPGYLGLPQFIVSDQAMPAITAVKLPAADKPMTGQYAMIPQDLNEGSGGKYIYLCTRRFTENWMEQLARWIEHRPLNRIAIPGTHDSGTYGFDSSSEYAPDDPGIRSALDPSLVLDIEGGSRQPGTRVILWTENVPASANQKWTLEADGHIRSALDPSLVLDVYGGSTAPETPLIVWTQGATASPNQLFTRVVR